MAKTDYLPVLDGCRAVSISIVMLAHYGLGHIFPAVFGVTVFFVVSGFLITRLLLTECAKSGTISLKDFYARRALRLYPVFLVMIAVGGLLYSAMGGHLTTADVLCAIFYGANYHRLVDGPGQLLHPFAILWSLSVEEHYYLVFPFIVLAFRRKPKRLAGCIAVLILTVTAWRCYVYSFWPSNLPMRIEHGTDTRVDSILFGSLLAVLLVTPAADKLLQCLDNISVFSFGVALVLASIVVRNPWFRETFRFTFQNVGLFFCIGGLIYGTRLKWLQKLLSHRAVVLFGRWSYSLYIWHLIVFVVAAKLLSNRLWLIIQNHKVLHSVEGLSAMLALIPIAVLIAAASYYGIERPMVNLRRRFGSHAAADRSVHAKTNKGVALEAFR